MIVLDASVVVDLLLNRTPVSDEVAERIRAARSLHAPHLLDAEITQVLRRFVLRGDLAPGRAKTALEDWLRLPISRYPHAPFLRRAFELRENITIYDALYVVLAEGLGAPLLTRDRKLAGVPGVRALVEVI